MKTTAQQDEMQAITQTLTTLDRWPLARVRVELDRLEGLLNGGAPAALADKLRALRSTKCGDLMLFHRTLDGLKGGARTRLRRFVVFASLAAALEHRAAPHASAATPNTPPTTAQQPPLFPSES